MFPRAALASASLVLLLGGCGDDGGAGARDGGGGGTDSSTPRDSGPGDDTGTPFDGGTASCVDPAAPGDGLHVTVDGTPAGDGSLAMPWDLASAIDGSHDVPAGSTIWVHGGTYTGSFRGELSGTAEAPIVVRAWPGERVTLDGIGNDTPVLGIVGQNAWYWGLEITNSDTDNRVDDTLPADVLRGGGVQVDTARDVRVINMAIHDTAQGISFWTPAVDSELYGNIISVNGYDAPDRPHGHAIYTQNDTGTKRIEDNVLFHGMSYGIHVYTEGGTIRGFDIAGNVAFQTGTAPTGPREGGNDVLIGGLQPAARIRLHENFGYSTERDRTLLRVGYSADNEDVVVTDNYVVGGTTFGAPWSSITMTGNTFIGPVNGVDTSMYADNEYLDGMQPAANAVFVRPNRYEEGRGHVIVYNFEGANEVAADLSSILEPGWAYEVRDAQNFFAEPVAAGVYDGGSVMLPMTGLEPAQPVGLPGAIEATEQTDPEFGVFVVLRTACP